MNKNKAKRKGIQAERKKQKKEGKFVSAINIQPLKVSMSSFNYYNYYEDYYTYDNPWGSTKINPVKTALRCQVEIFED